MEYVDIQQWERKEHYEFFLDVDIPQYNVCMNIDVTNFKAYTKEHKLSFYYSMVYASTAVMNSDEAFRFKIRDGQIIKHTRLNPSFTDMNKGASLFKIVTLPMSQTMSEFSKVAEEKSKNQNEYFPKSPMDQDQLIYFSCVPWIPFTSISNEMMIDKFDSIPRIIFGKYFEQDGKLLMPYAIQVNHMLLDGYHVGRYLEKLQTYLDDL